MPTLQTVGTQTCSENDARAATSADVSRQDGIMCGSADIGLK